MVRACIVDETNMNEQPEMISLDDAMLRGITRLRYPTWRHLDDYIKIDIVTIPDQFGTGKSICIGPWMRLYSVTNNEIHGKNPVEFLWALLDKGPTTTREKIYVEYTGKLSPDDEVLE